MFHDTFVNYHVNPSRFIQFASLSVTSSPQSDWRSLIEQVPVTSDTRGNYAARGDSHANALPCYGRDRRVNKMQSIFLEK